MPRPKNPNSNLPQFGSTPAEKALTAARSPAQGSGYPRRTELWWPCEAGHVVRLDWLPDRALAPHDVCQVPDCGAELHGPYATRADALADPVIQIARSALTRHQEAS
jgi:hypothetical protein